MKKKMQEGEIERGRGKERGREVERE